MQHGSDAFGLYRTGFFVQERIGMKKGEQNNKYFLILESCRSKKNCVRKIYNRNGKQISDPKPKL